MTARPTFCNERYADVLLPVAAGAFTYALPEEGDMPVVGSRVQVPFRRSLASGVVVALSDTVSDRVAEKLKPIAALEDRDRPFLPGPLIRLIQWTASYYLSPAGAVLKIAVPGAAWDRTGLKTKARSRPESVPDLLPRDAVCLSPAQAAALEDITSGESRVRLLLGVTGSGKTEVYIRSVQRMLDQGKNALVLVPEIALTAQMVARFRASFGDDLVVYHSGLSDGERSRAWWRVREGGCRIALGVRSAVFLPFETLGLIIVDEEHSGTYKQSDGVRYNARDLAVVCGSFHGCPVVLGSATPSLESYENAQSGRYGLLRMNERVERRSLPDITLIDMKTAPRASDSVSETMAEAIRDCVAGGGQALLLLNRRGFSHMMLCQDCGHVEKCPHCSVSMTFHKRDRRLKCHHCGGELAPRSVCSSCGGSRLAFLGEGTERAEEEIAALIPAAKSARMDYDTTRRKHAHEDILQDMESGETQVLLGTQMVAKGHDLPGVVLAGVLSADVLLGLPDFRSAERGVQLFSQLAGRAGRGDRPGRVLIQTHDPEHYIFPFVRAHDYEGFARLELEQRKSLGFPPYSRLVRIVLSGRKKETFDKGMSRAVTLVRGVRLPGLRILGPAPCPIERLRGAWRWHVLLKSRSVTTLRRAVGGVLDALSTIPGLSADVDVDPFHML